jgi:hypothetical protein
VVSNLYTEYFLIHDKKFFCEDCKQEIKSVINLSYSFIDENIDYYCSNCGVPHKNDQEIYQYVFLVKHTPPNAIPVIMTQRLCKKDYKGEINCETLNNAWRSQQKKLACWQDDDYETVIQTKWDGFDEQESILIGMGDLVESAKGNEINKPLMSVEQCKEFLLAMQNALPYHEYEKLTGDSDESEKFERDTKRLCNGVKRITKQSERFREITQVNTYPILEVGGSRGLNASFPLDSLIYDGDDS